MHKHERGTTRITVERLTVTTIRRGGVPQPAYCEICKQLIEPGTETPRLAAGNEKDDDNRNENDPT